MYVNAIEVTEIPGDASLARAHVSFTSYERQIQVMCDLRRPEADSPVKRRIALLREALRQLKRMPEFRAGRASIEFQPGLLPEEASQ